MIGAVRGLAVPRVVRQVDVVAREERGDVRNERLQVPYAECTVARNSASKVGRRVVSIALMCWRLMRREAGARGEVRHVGRLAVLVRAVELGGGETGCARCSDKMNACMRRSPESPSSMHARIILALHGS